MNAVYLELVMYMRTCRQAGCSNIADDLALLDVAAVLDAFCETLHMAVERAIGFAVLDDHRITVTAATASQDNLAIARRLDRRAAWCSIVDAFVGADLVQDRVFAAHGEHAS